MQLGKGAFAKYFVAQIASLNKIWVTASQGEQNLTWTLWISRIHGFCDDSGHTAIIMTFHALYKKYIHAALHDAEARMDLNRNDWQHIDWMCFSLQTKNIFIMQSDNILIEKMAPSFQWFEQLLLIFTRLVLWMTARFKIPLNGSYINILISAHHHVKSKYIVWDM